MRIVLFFAIISASVALLLGAGVQLHKNDDEKEAAKKEVIKSTLSDLLKSAIANEKKRVSDTSKTEKVATVGKTDGPIKQQKNEKLRALFNKIKRRKFLARRKQHGGSVKKQTGRSNVKRNQDVRRRNNLRKSKNIKSIVGKQISNRRRNVGKNEQLKRIKTYFLKRAEATGKKNSKTATAEKRQYDQYLYPTCSDCYTLYMSEGPYDSSYNYPSYGDYYGADYYGSYGGYDGSDYYGSYSSYGGYYDSGYYGNYDDYNSYGGYDSSGSHGNYDGYNSHGGYDSSGSHGNYDGYNSHGGYDGSGNHGNYDGYNSHGGYDSSGSHGNYDGYNSHGGYDGSGNHGNYDGYNSHGGYDSSGSHGNYDGYNSHGGYDSSGSHGNFMDHDFYNDEYFYNDQCYMMFEDESCNEPYYQALYYNGSCEIPCYDLGIDDGFEMCVMQEMSAMYSKYTGNEQHDTEDLDCRLTNLYIEIYERMNILMNYGYEDYYDDTYYHKKK